MNDEPKTVARLRERFESEILEVSVRGDDACVTLKRDRLQDIAAFLRDDPETAFGFIMDVVGVDYSELNEGPRFGVIYNLYSFEKNHRLRLRVLLEEDDAWVDSLVEVWKGANWFEREAYDLMGVEFRGHPFLRRILTHHEFVGHPLRKDYDHGKRQLCTTVWDLEFE